MIRVSHDLIDAAYSKAPVHGHTHNYYKYPARFSPAFVKQAIADYTVPGEVVFDPFMGGGTTLVEAMALNRKAIGSDISSLACFVSNAKTTLLSNKELYGALVTVKKICDSKIDHQNFIIDEYYHRNLNASDIWRIRNFIQEASNHSNNISSRKIENFVRIILLRTAQWALDGKKVSPTLIEMRTKMQEYADQMAESMENFRKSVRASGGKKPIIINASASKIHLNKRIKKVDIPSLVLTSPPYPGLHVLYHRWQVKGRKETPIPFWIANSLDGKGDSYYNLGSRHEAGLEKYFSNLLDCFKSVVSTCNQRTLFVQMVAFSDPQWQLPHYLQIMRKAGLEEIGVQDNLEKSRIWREVPNRKWYNVNRESGGKFEVVLFHRIANLPPQSNPH